MAASSKIETARAWLASQLSDGQPRVAGGLLLSGMEAGYSERALRMARHAIGAKEETAAYGPNARAASVILWYLPKNKQT